MTLPPPEDWPVDDPVADRSVDLLRERTRATPDATAVVDADTGEAWTFDEFGGRVSRRARWLADLGADAGRTGVALDTGPAFAGVYFAVGRRGGAVVPLNLDLPAEALRRQAERAGVDCIVCGRDTEELAVSAAPSDVPVASVETPDWDGPTEPSRGAEPPVPDDRPLDAERAVLFTSGTTGDPKGVRLTRGNLVASAVGSAYRLGVEPDDRWLGCLPMYHMGGLAPLVRSTLYGTTTVIHRSFDAAGTADAMAEYDVTGVSLVPTMLHRLLEAGWHPPDSLRFVLLGGGAASEDLLGRALGRGVPVYPTYGATETASQVATATPGEVREHPGTVGRPLRGTAVSVRAGSGENCDVGERGEVVVSGPTVTPGYLDGARSSDAFDEHGFHTGDLGYRDEAGRLWVVGRLDDRIVTGGENVHPGTVADALATLSTVSDAAVVGLPDDEWGERVAALVVPTDPADPPTPTDVREALRGRVADYALPKTVGVADTLPRTPSGTVDRGAVRDRLEDAADGD
ncbi:MAG: class I adenylate-forming enzyme family protein [Haloarculaceae archaeon]